MRSFLDSVVPSIRCMTANCRALAPEDNPITVQVLLYGEYICYHCKEVYKGALVDDSFTIPVDSKIDRKDAQVAAEVVSEKLKKLGQPKPFDKWGRKELVKCLDDMKLKLEDVPVSGRQVTNGDIRDYIISKRK